MTAELLGTAPVESPEWHQLRETWRPVPGMEGHYEVSDTGRVASLKYGKRRILKQPANSDGYPVVSLLLDGRRERSAKVHTLVTAAFLGPRPQGLETRHLDGNKANNRLPNLLYGTRSDNQRDNVAHAVHHLSRRTHCPQGHPYDEVNTYLRPGRGRRKGRIHRACRVCAREATRQYRLRMGCAT